MEIDSEIKYTYENIYNYNSYSKYILILFLILVFIYILVSLRKYN